MNDAYNNFDNYNPRKKGKVVLIFDYMIADVMSNKRFQAIIKELFIKCRKLIVALISITQSYFSIPK